MQLLNLDGDDEIIAAVVIEEALDLRAQYLRALAEATGTASGNAVGRVLAKAFRRK